MINTDEMDISQTTEPSPIEQAKQLLIEDARAREKAFGEELDALCKKHNVTLVPGISIAAK